MDLLTSIIPGIEKRLPLLNPIWLYLPDMQCNFKCKYCYMGRDSNIRGKCSHLYNFVLPKNLNESGKWIILYGGEILTDKKLLYALILEIRKHSNNPICFSSNGSLLTFEDNNFFKKTNVKISLSYDGKFQNYRGLDILKEKHDIIYDAISKEVIIGLNTIIHSKNYNDYKFDLPNIQIIHDYNYIYPLETKTNKSFLLDNSLSDEISNNVVLSLKNLIMDIAVLGCDQLVLKYPPSLFYLLNQFLLFKGYSSVITETLLCSQTNCAKVDIYGNTTYTCGKGLETSVLATKNIAKECLTCKFVPICRYKCPEYNFDKSQCKNTYMYKIYEKVDILLNSLKSKD